MHEMNHEKVKVEPKLFKGISLNQNQKLFGSQTMSNFLSIIKLKFTHL